jgi:hypothetical protein
MNSSATDHASTCCGGNKSGNGNCHCAEITNEEIERTIIKIVADSTDKQEIIRRINAAFPPCIILELHVTVDDSHHQRTEYKPIRELYAKQGNLLNKCGDIVHITARIRDGHIIMLDSRSTKMPGLPSTEQ